MEMFSAYRRTKYSFVLLSGFTWCVAALNGIVSTVRADFTGMQVVHSYGFFTPGSPDNVNRLQLASAPVPGAPNQIAVAGKWGSVDIINMSGPTTVQPLLQLPLDFEPYFDANPGLYVQNFEAGLLGLALHPNFNKPGMQGYRKFYVNATIDNSIVPNTPFLHYKDYGPDPQNPLPNPNVVLINPANIAPAQLSQINTEARIPDPVGNDPPPNPNSVLRQCFVCDHASMQMELRVNGQNQFTGVECFFDNGLGFTTGHKPAQTLNPMVTEIREYTAPLNGTEADPNTYNLIMRFPQARDFHNGGALEFGLDGMLYITTGDSKGHPTETHTYPERPDVDFYGKVLRIDVNSDGFADPQNGQTVRNYAIPPDNPFKAGPLATATTADDEVYAYGFRNPWRASVDRVTGTLRVADVGFRSREEVNFVTPGFNGGWPYYEGELLSQLDPTGFFTDPDGPGGPLPAHGPTPPYASTNAAEYSYAYPIPNNRSTTADNGSLVPPISENTFDDYYLRGAAIMGGVVYRGPDPTLQGRYIFYESGQRKMLMLNPNLSPNDPNFVTDISSKFFTYQDVILTDEDDVNGDGIPEPFSYHARLPRTPADGKEVGLIVSISQDDAGNLYAVSHFSGDVYKMATSNPSPSSILSGPGRRGDLNSDGLVNAKDIDLLAMAVRPGAKPPLPVYDLNGVGSVTYVVHTSGAISSDSDELVRGILATKYGDTDLDKDIDNIDIGRTFANFTGAGNTGRSWATGDFDGDGDTDTIDIGRAFGGFTGAGGNGGGAAFATAWGSDPTVIYDARNGKVVIDPGGATILSFTLQSDGIFSTSATNFGDLDESVLPGAPSLLVDNTAGQVGWVSVRALAQLGLNRAQTIGNILPAGLSADDLSSMLRHSWAGPRGTQGSFELVVIPEPGGLLMAILAPLLWLAYPQRPPQLAIASVEELTDD